MNPPPAAMAAVVVPPDAGSLLVAFKSPNSVQFVPFHDSLFVTLPPEAVAVFVAPALPENCLAVFKSFTSVQEVPSYCSVLPTESRFPPKAKAAVCVFTPDNAGSSSIQITTTSSSTRYCFLTNTKTVCGSVIP